MNQIKGNSTHFVIGFLVISILAGSLITGFIFFGMIGELTNDFIPWPWSTFPYFSEAAHDDQIGNALFISYLFGYGIPLAFALFILSPTKKKLHGDYHFAKEKDVKKSGLFELGDDTIFVGIFKGKYLYYSGEEFVLLEAPTRSKKGVSTIVPNLLHFSGSAVVVDIKLENYVLTSGFRKENGQDVFLFAPGSEEYETHAYNALGYINPDKFLRLNDIDKICQFLIPTPPNTDPMWSSEGRSLLKSVILLVLDTPSIPSTLGECLRQLRTEMPTKEYFESVIEKRGDSLDPECVRGMSSFAGIPDKTAGGIKTSVTGALNCFSNPLVDAATERNDFDLRELRKKKITLYLGCSQDDLETFAPVFRLLIQQIISLNTKPGDTAPRYDKDGNLQTGNPEIKHQCLLVLDEFLALGKMEVLSKGVSFIAGYLMRMMLAYQSQPQFELVYGREAAKNFKSNIALKLAFRPTEMEHAELLSRALGSTTFKHKTRSTPANMGKGGSFNHSDVKRQLMLPEEIMEMDDKDQIILYRNCPYPIYGERLFYYEEESLTERVLSPSFVPKVQPTSYPMRGRKQQSLTVIFDSVDLPEDTEPQLSDDEVNDAVDSFFGLLSNATDPVLDSPKKAVV